MLSSATVLGFSVYLLSWLFLTYSFLGVLIEGFFCLVTDGVLQLRLGLLYLPLRPLYGIGGVQGRICLQYSLCWGCSPRRPCAASTGSWTERRHRLRVRSVGPC